MLWRRSKIHVTDDANPRPQPAAARPPADGAARVAPGLRAAAWVAVAVGLGLALCSAWFQAVTTDEPLHLAWSRRLLEGRGTERSGNEFFESKTPISVANVVARKAARRILGGEEGRLLLFCARLPTVAQFALLLAAVALLARHWFDGHTAALAVIGCALDPSLIAHASLVTVDVPYALAHLLGLAAVVAFARRPSWQRGLVLGLALGFACVVKLTAFLLVPAVAIAVFFGYAGRAKPGPPPWGLTAASPLRPQTPKGLMAWVAGLTVAAGTAALLVCAAYGFAGVARPLGATAWSSRPLAALAGAWPGLRLPLPVDFLTGIDLTAAREEGADWRVVVLGRISAHGVPYYFPLLWLLKTPVLLLAAQALGLAIALARRRSPVLLFLAANLALALAYFCLAFHAQIGYRFVLPCVPLAWMVAAAGLRRWTGRWAAAAGALALAVAAGENAAYAGNHLAFTNLAVQPKREVFRLITDSNVDWGQNRDKLESYLAQAGVRRAALDPPHLLPGRNLLRHDLASGNYRFGRYRWLRENLDPVAHFGHTYLLFDVDPGRFERVLDETRRLEPSEKELAACDCAPAREPLLAPVPLRLRPGKLRGAVLCVSTDEGADFVVEGTEGALLVAPVDEPRQSDFLQAGQQVWYRLRPGLHALTAESTERFSGTLRLERGRAEWARCGKS